MILQNQKLVNNQHGSDTLVFIHVLGDMNEFMINVTKCFRRPLEGVNKMSLEYGTLGPYK